MFWIPLALFGSAAFAGWKIHKHQKGMTPERTKIFEAAFRTLKDPGKLRKLADAFEKMGLKDKADMLRKRAKLREMPADVKVARKEAWRKAMKSTDPAAVLKMAAVFEKEGAIGAADALRKYAEGLKAA